MSESQQVVGAGASRRRIRFVERAASGDVVLMTFRDPVVRYAIVDSVSGTEGKVARGRGDDEMDVVLLPLTTPSPERASGFETGFAEWLTKDEGDEALPSVFVKYRGVELTWRPGCAVLQCDSEQSDGLLAAVVEFTFYERELRRIERGIAQAWGELEEDKALAFEVTPADLERSGVVGGRMNRAMGLRIRLARLEPHLYGPEAELAGAGRRLGEELREKARMESRLETADGQLEVFEHVYEMSAQRMGEFRAARQEHVLEWVIIVLLAAEAFLMLAQALWKFAGW